MEDRIFKIKILVWFISDAINNWKETVWQTDLDRQYCCNGRECGCQGVSTREVYNDMIKKRDRTHNR